MVRDVAVTPRGCVIDCGAADIGLIAHNERSRTMAMSIRPMTRKAGICASRAAIRMDTATMSGVVDCMSRCHT